MLGKKLSCFCKASICGCSKSMSDILITVCPIRLSIDLPGGKMQAG